MFAKTVIRCLYAWREGTVTALSGTVVTTYDWDAAGRLEARDVSDGRSYTYTWSLRGEMTAEWTHDGRKLTPGDAAGKPHRRRHRW